MWDNAVVMMIAVGVGETLFMVFVSTFVGYVLGLPMGVLLVVGEKDGILPMPRVTRVLSFIANLVRSVPFIILLVVLIPFTRTLIGTAMGPGGTTVPLIIAAAPFIARMVESSIREVDKGVVEASLSMGASPMQIICKVLIPEAMPSLLSGAAIAATTILGYSAMAGCVGGGGLGDIAIRYGYNRYQPDIMVITVILLILIVQIIQSVGTHLSIKTDKRL